MKTKKNTYLYHRCIYTFHIVRLKLLEGKLVEKRAHAHILAGKQNHKKKNRKPLTLSSHFVTLHFQWRRPKPYPSFTRSNLSSPINFKWYPSLPFVLSQLHTYHFPFFFFSNFLFLWRDFLFSSISEGFCRIPPNSFHFMANN